MINEKMKKRIIFGSIMLTVLGGLFAVDWYLQSQAFPSAECLMSSMPLKDCNISKSNGFFSQSEFDYKYPGILVGVLLTGLVIAGYFEYRKMMKNLGIKLLDFTAIGALLLILILGSGWFSISDLANIKGATKAYRALAVIFQSLVSVLIPCIVLSAFLEQMIRGKLEDAVRRIGATLLGIGWLGFCAMMIFKIRMSFGTGILLTFLLATKFTDIGAYFTGSFFGKNKMIPWLSPGKTWEGLAGGLAASGIISLVLGLCLPLASNQPGAIFWIIFGVVCGFVGQFGDLCESLLKRTSNVKDSASIIPEFGGVLDLIDSPLIAAPVAFYMLTIESYFLNLPA